VHFVVNMAAKDVEKAEEQGLTEFFKLTSKIRKYNSPEEIIDEFYPRRLAYYQKHKASAFRFYSTMNIQRCLYY
jgi:DNA topoisomerase-2